VVVRLEFIEAAGEGTQKAAILPQVEPRKQVVNRAGMHGE